MKQKRQEKIMELIAGYHIGTQEELTRRLQEEGFEVTQATVSRDIRELGLTKMPAGRGKRYVPLERQEHRMADKYVGILREAFVSADCAGNILVIKTVSGMAMAVGAALDKIGWKEIVGCIAGDDTVMCVIRTEGDAAAVMSELERIVER